MKKVITADTEVEFTCECGGKCKVLSRRSEPFAFVHSLPFCNEFDRLPPDEYLRRNRRRIQAGVA